MCEPEGRNELHDADQRALYPKSRDDSGRSLSYLIWSKVKESVLEGCSRIFCDCGASNGFLRLSLSSMPDQS